MSVKNLVFILPSLALLSCCDPNHNSTINKQDTTISNSIIVQTDNIPSNKWCLNEMRKVLPQWPDSSLTLSDSEKINENVFYVLCNHSDGVSMTTYLFTFNNNKVKDYEITVYGPDQDLSSPSDFEYTELRSSTDNKFIVVTYIESVNDKSVLTTTGEFKTGFDFENVTIKTDSIVTTLSILNDGIIKRDTLK